MQARSLSLGRGREIAVDISLTAFFTVLMALAAHVRVGFFFTPVPFTLQTLALYLSLRFLKRKAVFSQVLYLLLGLSGFSVFAGAGFGAAYLAGPTGGFIVGFVLAAFIGGRLYPKEAPFALRWLFFAAVSAVVYFFGIAWLALFHGMSLSQALLLGLYPFVAAEVFKITIASFLSAKRP